jgi:RimJ/RimL family protein N-acetyltransferase
VRVVGPDQTPGEVQIREVRDSDLDVFFEHQLDPGATAMAAFPARERAPFLAHWEKIRAHPTNVLRTIVVDGEVAGNVVSWDQSGDRLVGYWLGRTYWGRGVATRALALFVAEVPARPLYANVAVHNVGSIRVLRKCGFRLTERAGVPASPPELGDVKELLFVLDRSG